MNPDNDIEALRDALVGTTRGPWTISRESPTIIVTSLSHIGLSDDAGVLIGSAAGYPNSGCYPSMTEGIANARFMAAASPDRIARLLDEIERLREDNETLNEIIAIHGNEINRLRADNERLKAKIIEGAVDDQLEIDRLRALLERARVRLPNGEFRHEIDAAMKEERK